MTMHPIDMYKKLVSKYGEDNMVMIAIEEMAELTKELTKYERADIHTNNQESIIEEIADVLIATDELMWLFGNHDEVDAMIEDKICRTNERMNEDGC